MQREEIYRFTDFRRSVTLSIPHQPIYKTIEPQKNVSAMEYTVAVAFHSLCLSRSRSLSIPLYHAVFDSSRTQFRTIRSFGFLVIAPDLVFFIFFSIHLHLFFLSFIC